VLLIDDLIATGGTALAAVALLRRTGAKVDHAGFVIDLFDLGGADKLRAMGVDVFKLVDFEGH
jgi:adenine phosphoribosyltransferase